MSDELEATKEVSIPYWSDFNPVCGTGPGGASGVVSIPYWSDFNTDQWIQLQPGISVSIPYWSDFNPISTGDCPGPDSCPLFNRFNPILVRFQHPGENYVSAAIQRFNPILVRFQPQLSNGSAPTQAHAYLLFQSILVRFQHRTQSICPPSSPHVSIPYWSDFNVLLWAFQIIRRKVSIPYWSDFNLVGALGGLAGFMFQSHIGPISTRTGPPVDPHARPFHKSPGELHL